MGDATIHTPLSLLHGLQFQAGGTLLNLQLLQQGQRKRPRPAQHRYRPTQSNTLTSALRWNARFIPARATWRNRDRQHLGVVVR